MSWQASGWAIEQQHVQNPVARHVLLVMANYANQDGTAAFASIARIVRDTGWSERCVRKAIRELQQVGVLRPGDKAVALAYIKRADRVPQCYDLVLDPVSAPERGARGAPRESPTGGTSRPSGGHVVPPRGARGAPNPSGSTHKQESVVQTTFAEDFQKRFGCTPKDLARTARKGKSR